MCYTFYGDKMKKIKNKEKKLSKKELVTMLLSSNELDEKDEEELMDLLVDQPISIDIDKLEDSKLTYGEKVVLILDQ